MARSCTSPFAINATLVTYRDILHCCLCLLQPVTELLRLLKCNARIGYLKHPIIQVDYEALQGVDGGQRRRGARTPTEASSLMHELSKSQVAISARLRSSESPQPSIPAWSRSRRATLSRAQGLNLSAPPGNLWVSCRADSCPRSRRHSSNITRCF